MGYAMLKGDKYESRSENIENIEQEILKLGRDIFSDISREQPSILSKNFWSSRLMQWSMDKPDLKLNLFRFVDVLPTLRSNRSIAKHIREYLRNSVGSISSIAGWALAMHPRSPRGFISAVTAKFGVKQMAQQFIAGENPPKSLHALKRIRSQKIGFTVDLLGEYSVSELEADAYVERYINALEVFGKNIPQWKEAAPIIAEHPGERTPICISVKLTALYSQCSPLNVERSVQVLSEKLAKIARKAKEVDAQIYIDAEDSGNNEIVYKVFKNVFSQKEFLDYPYPGIVVQAYALKAEETLLSLIQFAQNRGRPIAIRLVKGAYWDHETILSQQNDWPSPLFKIKESSDANYERLSRILVDNHQYTLPAFGSHNVRSLAHACEYALSKGLAKNQFELQMLYGMADPICKAFVKRDFYVRQYVPLGEMLPGMGYLIRRLLENTSNESFLRHTFFENDKVDQLLAKPEMRE